MAFKLGQQKQDWDYNMAAEAGGRCGQILAVAQARNGTITNPTGLIGMKTEKCREKVIEVNGPVNW